MKSSHPSAFHLAQLNVALARAPLESPEMADFTRAIGSMNALAERSAGFVWRLVGTPEVDAEGARIFGNASILITLSVWESIDALKAFTYQGAHGAHFRRRAEWFQPFEGPNYVLWWIPAGSTPSMAEAHRRLQQLAERGPGPDAFGFQNPYPAPA